jgi:putative intracellular protease/amidase
MSKKKVLFVITNHHELGKTGKKTGFYLPEVSHPAHVLTTAGWEIDFVSPKGGLAPRDPSNEGKEDEHDQWFLKQPQLFQKTQKTLNPQEVDPTLYQAIFYAGGHGTMWDFRSSPKLNQVAVSIYEQGGIVAAVCHGPAGLVDLTLSNGKPLVEGKEVAAFSNDEEEAIGYTNTVPFLLESELAKKGAIYSKSPLWQEHVKVDQRLVTGQNPASAMGVGRAMLALLSA